MLISPPTIQKFDLSKRKVDKLMDEVNDFTVSFDGEKILYRKGDSWSTASVDDGPAAGGAPPKPGFGPLKLDGWEVYVEPRAMWKQIYNETWRIERDFFYDPHYHGLDLDKAKKKYAPYLDGIASREELTYLFQECLGEMTVGHMFVGGGEAPEPKKLKGGLLGADYSLENGRYRVAKVYDGENWNPGNEAPLTQPGVNVKAGDYILAVNGRDLHASDNIYSFFEETAGKQVVLKVGPNPDGKESREVTVDSSRERRKPAPPCLDRETIAAVSIRLLEAALRTCTFPTPQAAVTPASTATSFHKSARKAPSSTSGSMKAGSWPTTSSTTCVVP